MPSYPEITYRFPTLASGPQSSLKPTITIDWSADMETTQFSNSAQRAESIVLLDVETGTVIGTDFVDYTAANKRLELQPSTDLSRGKVFRIVIKSKLSSTDGRKSFNEYNWTFTTASGSITNPTLVSPGDATVQSVFPTLTWAAVASTGTVNYVVQIDDRWDFGSLAYTTTTTATAVTPAGVFADDTTYYWRVMAYTSGATGMWSDVWSFYYGIRESGGIDTRQFLPDSDSFGVSSIGFKNGSSNRSAYPTISFTFTSTPASSFESYLTVVAKSVLPRNDDLDTYDESVLAGTWTLSGDTLTFVPSDAIANNTRYEVRIAQGMTNTDGALLAEDYTYYWTSRYSPYYVSARVIRARFLGAEQQVPDDLIDFYIHMASLEANARYYAYLQNPYLDLIGDSLSEPTVRDQAKLQSYGVLKWVEAATAYKLIKAILMENLRDIGRTERLGDGLVQLTADFVKGIEKALAEIKGELEEWENYLTPSDVPLATPRGYNWSPYVIDWDSGLRGPIADRDNEF